MERIRQAEHHAHELANQLNLALLMVVDEKSEAYDPLLAIVLREKREQALALRDELNALKQAIAKRK